MIIIFLHITAYTDRKRTDNTKRHNNVVVSVDAAMQRTEVMFID